MGQKDGQGGFTLVESLIGAIVLAVAMIAVSVAVTSGHMQSQHALHAQRALRLAEELMEFILALPYHDPQGDSAPGPETGEAGLSDFDNADDLHGFTMQDGAIANMAGEPHPPEYQIFGRSVWAEYVSRNVDGLGDPIFGLSVTVAVWDTRGRMWTLTRFIPEPTD